MSFAVSPADIDGFAKLIGRAADDIRAGVSYIDNKANEDGFQVDQGKVGQWWQEAYGNHTERVQDAKRFLRKVAEILDASCGELKKSAKYYHATDCEQAAKMDSTYPGSKRGKPDDLPSADARDFQDAHDARSKLKPLEADPGFFDVAGKAQNYAEGHAQEFQFNAAFKTFGTALDMLSPSALIAEGLKLIFDFDPFGEIATLVGGDWEGYLKCAGLWGKPGQLLSFGGREYYARNRIGYRSPGRGMPRMRHASTSKSSPNSCTPPRSRLIL
ncbi:hypothetical protein [Streptomyces platensis]|uniref:hypothetical protein n=1 Tax=Streptomyces platensis TaxID=58346 RepID=UPI00386E449C|nr:hypothetical protein OG962_14905 [Streptomyces platensis]